MLTDIFSGVTLRSIECGATTLLAGVETDDSTNNIAGKIQETEKAKVHNMLVIGGRDMDAGAVSVRLHGKGPQGAEPKGEVVAEILAAIRERRA